MVDISRHLLNIILLWNIEYMNKLFEAAKKAFDDMEYKNKNVIPEYIIKQLTEIYGVEYIDQFEAYDENVVHIKDTNFYIAHHPSRNPELIYEKYDIHDQYNLYDLGYSSRWSDNSKYSMSDDIHANLIKLHKGITYLTNLNKSWYYKLFKKSI